MEIYCHLVVTCLHLSRVFHWSQKRACACYIISAQHCNQPCQLFCHARIPRCAFMLCDHTACKVHNKHTCARARTGAHMCTHIEATHGTCGPHTLGARGRWPSRGSVKVCCGAAEWVWTEVDLVAEAARSVLLKGDICLGEWLLSPSTGLCVTGL